MWSDVPNLRHLRAFVTVADCAGVSRAGRLIHLSQPAITQALGRLDARFGMRLLEHGAGAMTPTAAGARFHDRARRALDLLARGAQAALGPEPRKAALGPEPRKAAGGFTRFDLLLTVAQLRALSALAMAGNFSLAAREVGRAQPSIHRAARDLERISGLALFATTARGIALTRAGEALARHASLALAELEQGFAELAEAKGRDTGQIVIGSLPLARTAVLPEAINRLTRERPGLRVRVIGAPYDGMLHRLRHGIIDFLIGALRDPPPIGDIVQEKLFDDSLAVIARPGHPLAGRAAVAREDLLAFPWVVPVEETPTRAVFHHWFNTEELDRMPGGIIETSSLGLLRGVLAGSDRLSILSARQVRDELAHGMLCTLPVVVPFGRRPIGFTFRRDWRPTGSQARLLDHIRALAAG